MTLFITACRNKKYQGKKCPVCGGNDSTKKSMRLDCLYAKKVSPNEKNKCALFESQLAIINSGPFEITNEEEMTETILEMLPLLFKAEVQNKKLYNIVKS